MRRSQHQARFRDRVHAGQALAAALGDWRGRQGLLVLALPRGGVPVGAEVARELGCPLDVLVVRKVGVPWQPELAMGAVGEDGARLLDHQRIREVGVDARALEAAIDVAERQLAERLARFREVRPAARLEGREVIVVDDGVATGMTARAACRIARARGARRVVLATPVAPPGWTDRLGDAADAYVAVRTPEGFMGVGGAYADFRQTSAEEVERLLAELG